MTKDHNIRETAPGTKTGIFRSLAFLFALIICSAFTSAKDFAQTRITLKFESADLRTTIRKIEAGSEARFVYNESLMNKPFTATVNVKNEPLDNVLKMVFGNSGIRYRLTDNNLVLLAAEKAETDIAAFEPITGTITDPDGNPVVGASIVVKGTTIGTAANAAGSFTIEASIGQKLMISAIGFQSQEVTVGSNAPLTIVMMPSLQNDLTDVVVVGYGTQKKRDLTGSITSVKGEELAKQPNTNPVASLQGRVPGLTVANAGGAGSSPIVRIRGVNSTNSASPVYVVDGILLDDINFINPADIETIDVLRDPSSIAIYGLRGANGVIAITTKRAAKGKTRINLTSNIGVQTIVNTIDVVDAAGFKTLYDAQLRNLNAAPFDYTNYTANTNWQDQVFRDAVLSVNNLSISNNSEKTSTYLNLGYTYQDGVLKNDQFQRYMLRLNEEIRISKNFKVGGDITGYHFRDNPAAAGLNNALWAAPIVPIRDGDAFYSMPSFQRAQVANPVGNLERNDRTSVNQGFRIITSLFTEFTFLKNFTWKSTVYADLGYNTNRGYNPLANTVIDLGENGAPTTTFQDPSVFTSVNQSQSEFRRFQQDHTLTWNKRVGDGHNLNVLGGFTTIYNYNSNINGNRRDTSVNVPNDPNYWYLSVVPANNPGNYGGGGSESSIVGGFGRVSYNYKGRYLVNATLRRDASSKFAPENRWGTFGSVGVGWVLTDEIFMDNVRVLDFFKLRGAWGTTGNANGFADNLWRPGISNASTAVFGNNVYTSIQASYIPDPNLKWEVVQGLDVGFDLKTLGNRLDASFTYYDRTTTDILTGVEIPNETRRFFTNLGDITNRGIEVALGWSDDIGSDFSYNIGGNFSYNENVVNSIGDKIDFQLLGNGGVNRTISGSSIGHFFGYEQTGIYQTTADLAKTPAFTTSLPGDISFRDANGDGVISPADRIELGTPFPPYSFGASIGFKYKGFDFQADGQGMAGHKIYTQRRNANFAVLNYEANRLNAWRGPGTSNVEPVLNNTRGNNYLFSTYFLEPADYFRIRMLQIGYSLGSGALKSIGLTAARFYLSGQNIVTWSRVTGYSPEPLIGSILGGGADNGVYPIPAVYSFGLNVTF